jgi:regulator of PEP synthase PpsR (kinase-PPPase family)
MKKQTNLHLISDSTGETLTFIAKAVLSQFPNLEANEFQYFLTKTASQLEKPLENIINKGGIVLYTILNEEAENLLLTTCKKHNILCLAAIMPIVKQISAFIGIESTKTVGGQHFISEEYYNRMEAINYTLNHDDGNMQDDLSDADIIILGVSRSSKSPTSIYLAYKGYKVGNIPFVKIENIPKYIKSLKKPLIVGFTIDPERLKIIRQVRIKTLAINEDTNYTDIRQIKEEIAQAKKLFSALDIPVINVTQKSIEETAVMIINLLHELRESQAQATMQNFPTST